jgi:hypothetical protein
MENPNPDSLTSHLQRTGTHPDELVRLLRGFTGYAEAFRAASEKLEKTAP